MKYIIVGEYICNMYIVTWDQVNQHHLVLQKNRLKKR